MGLCLASLALLGCEPAGAVPHLPFPQLQPSLGRVLSPLRLVTLVSEKDPFAADLLAASDRMMASEWLRATGGEYGVVAGSSVHAKTAAPKAGVMDDYVLSQYVWQAIDAGQAPAPDGITLYLVYLPAGVDLTWGSKANIDCRYLGGYHRRFGVRGDEVGVVQRCPNASLSSTTMIGSHELIEGATDPAMEGYHLDTEPLADPWTGSVWRTIGRTESENADLCQGTRYSEGGVMFERSYSNRAAAAGGDPCVPALKTPYYNAGAAKEWYTLGPKGEVDVPLTGWSDPSAPQWILGAGVQARSSDSFDVVTTLDGPQGIWDEGAGGVDDRGRPFPYIGNGQSATLHVTTVGPLAPGSWAVLRVYSFPDPGTGTVLPKDADRYHYSLVGVYNPR